MVTSYVPDAGDIVMMDFDPQVGREQAKRRPALVLTDQRYNRASGLAVVCPLTSKRKPYPFALPITIDKVEGRSFRRSVEEHGLDRPPSEIPFHGRTSIGEQGSAVCCCTARAPLIEVDL
jgi:hypothetical protein